MATIVNGLFAGRSGIQSHGAAIATLADNIANANTVGFKASRAEFSDLLAGSIGGQGKSAGGGAGSTVLGVTQIFNQGTFEYTGRGLDLGIDGNGFFVLEDVTNTRFFSRAGNMKVDADGILRDQTGLAVMGFPSSGSGSLQELNLNDVQQQSVKTTAVTVSGNLNASSDVTAIPGPNPTFAQLSNAASFKTFVDVFDSLGDSHSATVYFFNYGAGSWRAAAYVDGDDITGGTAGMPSQIGPTATITFDASGARDPQPVGPDITAAPAWSNGALSSDIDFTFDPFSQFASASNISSISQDGTGGGSVVSFNVEKDGSLYALLDNGQSSAIGKIALANFASPEGLQRQGDSLYSSSNESGEPVIGTPNSGQFGALNAGALELSTSDIANDFIKLISLQRGFQGSSRIITSINDLLQEIINLAR